MNSKTGFAPTADQARAIAFLATTLRPDWHQTAVTNALADSCAADLQTLAFGAISAAADPEAKTPKAMNFPERAYFTPNLKVVTNDSLQRPLWKSGNHEPADVNSPTIQAMIQRVRATNSHQNTSDRSMPTEPGSRASRSA